MMPRWIVIESRDAVEECLFELTRVRGCDLKIEDVISTLVTCAMHLQERDEDFLKYVAKVRQQFRDKVSKEGLTDLTYAIGELGTYIFKQCELLGLYSSLGILWYEFHGLLGDDIVLMNMSALGEMV